MRLWLFQNATGFACKTLGASGVKFKKEQNIKTDFDTSDSLLQFDNLETSVQLDCSVTENKNPTHKPTQEFKFLPHRTFSPKPCLPSLLQKQKRCITYFIFYLVCTTFAFAQTHKKSFFHSSITT